MVAARTFENALLDSKPVAAEAGALLEKSFLKRAAMSVDPIIDAAAINASVPDNATNKAAKKVQKDVFEDMSPGGVNALFNATNNERLKQQGGLHFVGTEEVERRGQRRVARRSAEPEESTLDKGVALANTALGYGVMVPLVADMALPLVGGAVGMLGFKGTRDLLNAPKDWMTKTPVSKNVSVRQLANDGIQLGFSAIQTYGVAKGFVDNMAAMKEMYTAVTGEPAPSTMGMLSKMVSGDMPPVLKDAGKHFALEYGSRGLIQVAGWGLMIRDLMKAHKPADIEAGRIQILAGIVPGIASMGIDMLMGQAATEVYGGFKRAYESGQPIGPNEYAAYILASSSDLAKRRVAKQVAMEIGAEYAQQKTHPDEILRQINDGRFNARIEHLVAKDEAELTKRIDAAKAKHDAAVAAKASAHGHAPAKELTMLEKVKGAKPHDRPNLGHFTGMVNEQSNAMATNVTRP